MPNTPKQIQIVNALGYKGFEYAHLPLVLGEDKKRLSKRHAATDLMSYKADGYLPEAVLNMLAKLGWSKTEEDIFTLAFLIDVFEIDQIQRSGSIFDIERLNFVNQAHLSQKTDDELSDLIKPFNTLNEFSLDDHHDPHHLIRLCLGSGNNLRELSSFIKPFVAEFEEYNEPDFSKHLLGSEAVLKHFIDVLKNIDDWTEVAIDHLIEDAKDILQLPMPKIGLPLRVALIGRAKSPQLGSTIYLINKELVIKRLEKALKILTEH